MTAPNVPILRLSLLSLCVRVCVSLQWLCPRRRQAAAVRRRRCRRGTANLPQGHRNSSSLKLVSTANATFISSPLDETGAKAWHWWLYAALFQELECAVSVEEDNRQEWTFTLYDFDNNGKVTREVTVIGAEALTYEWANIHTVVDVVGTVIPIMVQVMWFIWTVSLIQSKQFKIHIKKLLLSKSLIQNTIPSLSGSESITSLLIFPLPPHPKRSYKKVCDPVLLLQ